MKTFDSFEKAFKWIETGIQKGKENAVESVSEQIYKDSRDYTYYGDSNYHMYQSGEMHSDFQKGLVIERTPYVRRRYYEGGTPGKNSPALAQARWFEKAFDAYKKDYQTMLKNAIVEALKKG